MDFIFYTNPINITDKQTAIKKKKKKSKLHPQTRIKEFSTDIKLW